MRRLIPLFLAMTGFASAVASIFMDGEKGLALIQIAVTCSVGAIVLGAILDKRAGER